MDKDFWNNYFKSETEICLKYEMDTMTKPVVYLKDCFGNMHGIDINIKHEINGQ